MKHDGARAGGRPERVGPYPIVDRIGAGAFGEVFLAKHPSTGALVCVKRAHPNPAVRARSVAMFLDEAKILSRLSHPNIVSVFDLGQDGGVPYLVMEHVEGVDLASLLRTMPGYRLPAEVAARAVVELARALACAHAQAVIHRDVKPANVLVGTDGQVKLADFGVARLLRGGPYAATSTRREVGSEPYMAPEMLSADTSLHFDHRVDLWSLGVLAWECLCGFRPFEDAALGVRPDVEAGQWALVNLLCNPPRRRSIHDVAPDAPEALRGVIEGLLQPVVRRTMTADDVVRQLLDARLGVPEHQLRLAELITRDTALYGSGVRTAEGAMHDSSRAHEHADPSTAPDAGEAQTGSGVQPRSETGPLVEPDTDLALPAPFDGEAGSRIGPYTIIRTLGTGGMGATYVARRDDVHKRVCLKVIRREHAADPRYRKMFEKEVNAAGAASHPNVVSLIDFGTHESGELWAAFDLVDGTDLNTLLRITGGAVPSHLAALVVHDLASGLLHLHTPDHRREAIVHRDVSLANGVVSYDGHAMLIDLGIAKVLDGPIAETDAKGKIPYMAPEAVRGVTSAKVDQWALGVLIYRLLTGRLPYRGLYDGSPLPPLESPHGALDPRWSAIVTRLLRPDPDERYPSLAEMIDELAPLIPGPSARREFGQFLRKKAPPKSIGVGPDGEALEEARRAVIAQRDAARAAAGQDGHATQAPATAPTAPEPPAPAPTPPPRRDPGKMQPGDRLGEWEIVRHLGTGGMAVVYEAARTRTIGGAQRAALKLIRPELVASDDFVTRFRSEVEIAMRLNHQNIVHVLDAGEVEGVYFMAMEYVDGCDVDTLVTALTKRGVLSERRLPPDLAVYIGVGLLHGLEYAHQAGVVHRDVSPHNIMITGSGEVKLNDFGVAKPMRADGMASKTQHSVGKPHYMPTEQFRGDPLDGRTDLFAAGVSVYEWLAGTNPFAIRRTPDETFHMVVKRVFEDDRPRTVEVAPHAPAELIEIVERMLNTDRAHRPSSAEDVLNVLERLVQLRSKRVLGELVRAVKGEPAAPISQSVLDAVRVAAPAPPRRSPGRTVPLAPGATQAMQDAVSEAPAPPRPSRTLRLVVALLALVVMALATFAAVLLWPPDPRLPAPNADATHTPEDPRSSSPRSTASAPSPSPSALPSEDTATSEAVEQTQPTAATEAAPPPSPTPTAEQTPATPSQPAHVEDTGRASTPRVAPHPPIPVRSAPSQTTTPTPTRTGGDTRPDRGDFGI